MTRLYSKGKWSMGELTVTKDGISCEGSVPHPFSSWEQILDVVRGLKDFGNLVFIEDEMAEKPVRAAERFFDMDLMADGICPFCHEEYTSQGIVSHVRYCPERAKVEAELREDGLLDDRFDIKGDIKPKAIPENSGIVVAPLGREVIDEEAELAAVAEQQQIREDQAAAEEQRKQERREEKERAREEYKQAKELRKTGAKTGPKKKTTTKKTTSKKTTKTAAK